MRLYGTFRADGQSAHHTLAEIDNVTIADQDLSRCLIHLAEAGKIYKGSQRVLIPLDSSGYKPPAVNFRCSLQLRWMHS